MAHPHHAHRAHKAAKSRVQHILGHKRGGAAKHGDEAADRKLFHSLIKEHEHKVHGHASGGRLDKYARGGGTKKGKNKHHTQVNVLVAPHRGPPSSEVGAPPGAGAPLPVPPAGGLPPGGPPVGGPPPMPGGGMPPPPMKRGGRAYKHGGGVHMTAGADSGVGRLQKARAQKKH